MSVNHSNNPEYDEVAISRPFNGLDLNQIIKLKDEFIKVDGLREEEKFYVPQDALLACDSMAYCRRTEVHTSENKESHRVTEVTDGRAYVDDRDFKLLTLEEELGDGSAWKVITSFWQKKGAYPTEMYILIICCSLGAAVQGWDEMAVNGAQVFYAHAFGIAGEHDNERWTPGFVNAAPYITSFNACFYVIRFRQVVPTPHD